MDDSALVILIVIAVTLPILVFGLVWILRHGLRNSEVLKQRSLIRHQHFAGYPEVVLDPAVWRLGVNEIRNTAAEQGYQEIPTAGALLVFRLAAPTDPARASGISTTTPPDVAKRLASTARFVWLSSADARTSAQDIVAAATRHGWYPRIVGTTAYDSIVLATKEPVRHLREVRQLPRARRMRAAVIHWSCIGVALVCLFPAGFLANAGGHIMWIISGLLFTTSLCALGLTELPYIRGKPAQLTRLLSEFDGRGLVTISVGRLKIPDAVVGQIANQLGYSFGKTGLGSRIEGRTRKVKFFRRP
ncbi:hypothetical protein EV191_105179 [Tamaricihabitans halophyticus]|uniref:Uncharacterized protein n=1 Tax=Tamaricihabitans halophyticus TaxID=1262583 RepID=A0A4V2SU39_9PSEU|nr:hypothetical protein [Tamaricihabitans halophyticus]TCP53116.1 hypothetical protein EV191_105179 [Tamaricihabitans halophyticus]